LKNLHCKYYILGMALMITPEVRKFYKQLASEGGKARARRYDHATLSRWAKMGGRPRKNETAAKEPIASRAKGRK